MGQGDGGGAGDRWEMEILGLRGGGAAYDIIISRGNWYIATV